MGVLDQPAGQRPGLSHDWRDDLMASTSLGRLYRIDRSGNVEDVTMSPYPGNADHLRQDRGQVVMAAGKQIVRFAGQKTEVLSEDAPLSTFMSAISTATSWRLNGTAAGSDIPPQAHRGVGRPRYLCCGW